MKKIIGEFKTFITRGNVLDMAVGVIVGGAFTGVVNGLSNYILKPIINWILALVIGKDGLSGAITMLSPAWQTVEKLDETGAPIVENGVTITEQVWDLANSIYIDWGSFISAIINFFLIAFVLFVIVKLINKFREENKDLKNKLKEGKLTKEQKKELRANGIKIKDTVAVEAYFAEKKRIAEEAAAAAAAEAAEKARLDREANPTTEDLLKSILAELKKNG